MANRKLKYAVDVIDPDTNDVVHFGPGTAGGDNPPAWAREQITNPQVWADAADNGELDTLKKDELLELADDKGVEVSRSATKAEIIEAITAAS